MKLLPALCVRRIRAEYPGLLLCVGGGGIGHRHVERDLVVLQRGEDRVGEVRQSEPSEDEPLGLPDALGDVGGLLGFGLDHVAERHALVGRVHVELVEVLREAGLRRFGPIGKDEYGDLEVERQIARLDGGVHLA